MTKAPPKTPAANAGTGPLPQPKQTDKAKSNSPGFFRRQSGGAKLSNPLYNGKPLHSGSGIVPSETIAGTSLLVVIAIMAFLACLTLGIVTLVNQSASDWQNDISREVTIQIRPFDDVEMEKAIQDSSRIALSFEGVSSVTALTDEATKSLLEPWLGSGLELSELPVPQLMIVSIIPEANPDLKRLAETLEAEVPGASLDDHRAWVHRLTAMAWVMIFAGISIFALVMAATVLTVVFATKGSMAGNKDVVEVLHFVGAQSGYIANQFQQHFLLLGLKGAAIGGVSAISVFIGLGLWTAVQPASSDTNQLSVLFGSFSLGWLGYLGIILVLVSIAFLTAATSRWTVVQHVNRLYSYRK